jgi:tetratricopeptide (TPR) repeat protein
MERQQNYEAAIACYSLAFGLTPGTDDVWYFLHNNLGFCLNHFEKYEEAEPYCRQAIEMYPARHNAYKNLGISLQGQAQYLAAAEQFLKAVLICSNDPRALSDLKLLGQQHPEIPPLDRGEV